MKKADIRHELALHGIILGTRIGIVERFKKGRTGLTYYELMDICDKGLLVRGHDGAEPIFYNKIERLDLA